MSNTRKNTDAEWEVHKRDIETLYLAENKTRDEVMQAMEETHGFRASKAQYIRKFKQWNFKKYSTNDKWKFVARHLEKRKLDGKESETYINGKLIPRKKVKKEVSRYYIPSSQQISNTAPSPAPPNGVEIRTPQRERTKPVEYFHIPWFEFEVLVEPQFELLRTLAQGQPSMCSLHSAQFLGGPSDLLNVTLPSQLNIFTDRWEFQGVRPSYQVCGTSDLVWSDQSVQDFNTPIQTELGIPFPLTTQISSSKARSLFADIIGNTVDPDGPEYLSTIASQLDDILIEREDGELVRNIKKMVGPSILESSFQLLRYSIYLSSNNLLSPFHTDKLLRWVVESGQFAVIDRLIRMRKPTTEIFASNLLVSAARLQDVKSVRAFIALGIDVNIPAGQYVKSTALYEATAQRDINIVKLLLDAGADPNLIGPNQDISPLQEAVLWFESSKSSRLTQARASVNVVCEKNDLELVRILLEAGADVNIAPHKARFPKTLLLSAVQHRDPELVRMLLDWKAHVSLMTETSMTALQGAAKMDNIEIVQLLLAAGADFDAPAGKNNETARAMAVNCGQFDRLISPIQYAAWHDHTEMVLILLLAGAEVDGYVQTGEEYLDWFYCEDDCPPITPLQHAVGHENAVLVRQLLLAGAETDGQGYGSTPLQIAAKRSNIELVKLLLGKGAAVNAAAFEIDGRTALQAAAERGNHNLVNILIDAGADINAQAAPEGGCTALQAAAQARNLELVEALIRLGADVNAEPSPVQGRTCLQAAAEIGHSEMIQMLLKYGANINASAACQRGRTALQAALERNHIPAVEILLGAGADINAAPSESEGLTALFASVQCQKLELVQRLLRTANPNGKTTRESPLMRAAELGATDVVQCLIQAGANVNYYQRDYPKTALEIAVARGHISVVNILLAAGADINGSTSERYNTLPLERAVENGRTELVQLLLSKGANPNSFPDCALPNSTALGRALCRRPINWQILHLLVAAGADVNRASDYQGMPLPTGAKDLEVVRFLLKAGAKVNGTGPDGVTALQVSVMSNNIDIIRDLLHAEADVNAPAGQTRGLTALQAAAKQGKPHLVSLLLQHGADPNAPAGEFFGATALQAAAIGGHLRIALMLLKAGADVNAPPANFGGRTALEAAAEHGRLDLVSLLLKNDTDIESLEVRCKKAAGLAISNGNIFISKFLNEYKTD